MLKKLCCPKFKPETWDEKIFEWKDKKFIKGRVGTCFYVPLNFGGVISKMMKLADEAEAKNPEYMCLSEHPSKWRMNLLVAVDKEIETADNMTLSGKFISKVYEGNFKDTEKWMKDFQRFVASKKIKIGKTYMWYTTCPKCAKKYHKNYVVIVGELE